MFMSTVVELDASPCVVVLGVLGASAVVEVLGVHQLLTNSVQEAARHGRLGVQPKMDSGRLG